jgi:hypothetical protein
MMTSRQLKKVPGNEEKIEKSINHYLPDVCLFPFVSRYDSIEKDRQIKVVII